MSARAQPEIVVVGAGLAGLSAAICVQAAGRRCIVIERRAQPGGLCGTHVLGGREFPIACNDFGTSLAAFCRRTGVALELRAARTRFHFVRRGRVRRLELPLSLRTALNLLGHARAGLGLWRSASEPGIATLADWISRAQVDGVAADWLASLGYPIGLAPARLPVDLLAAEFSREHGYGYDRPQVPVGGPGVLAAAIARRFEELGGAIRYGCELRAWAREVDAGGRSAFTLATSLGEIRARAVITSEPRASAWPARALAGLEFTTLHLAASRALAWPRGHHTLTWFPEDVAGWLGALDAGESPREFGFHVYESGVESDGELALGALCFLPRGLRDPTPAQRAQLEQTLLGGLERLLPGFGAALRFRQLVAPADFERIHALSPAACWRAPLPGVAKPECFDPQTGLVHAGSSVGPPGEHAGQALRSGEWAARTARAEIDARK
jgi:phytoene dehydrogenase-like protein